MMQRGVFFGWWVTIAFAVMIFLSTGIRFRRRAVPQADRGRLGVDRAQFSLVIALSLFLYGAFQPFVGRLVDRIGARSVVIVGAFVLGASLALTGAVTRLWHFYVVYGVLVALGLAATGHVVASAVIARWFTRRRGTVLSALGGAAMAGMSLLVPVAMWLILTVGWRWTYVGFGVVVVVVIVPLGLWLVRESPEALGMTPDGGPPEATATIAGAAVERTSVSDAVQTPSFLQLSGGLFTCGFSMSLLSAHGVPMLTDHGYDAMVASWALGVLGASAMLLSMLIGAQSDRLGRRPVLAWLYGTRGILFAGLFVIRDMPAVLIVLTILGGVSMAGSLAMTSALTAEIFGRFSVGSVFGTIFLVHQAGAALGSWLGGFFVETTGGYGAAFGVACALLIVAAIVSIDDRRARAVRCAYVACRGRMLSAAVREGSARP